MRPLTPPHRRDPESRALRFWLAVGIVSGILALAILACCLIPGP